MKNDCRTLMSCSLVLFFLFLAGCACTQRVCNLPPGSNVVYQGGGKNGIRVVGADGCVEVPCDTNVTPIQPTQQ